MEEIIHHLKKAGQVGPYKFYCFIRPWCGTTAAYQKNKTINNDFNI